MRTGMGAAFEHSLRVAEQEFQIADDAGALTWRHRVDVAVARVRAEGNLDRLLCAVRAAREELAEMEADILAEMEVGS